MSSYKRPHTTITIIGYHKDLEDRRKALGERRAGEWSWLGAVAIAATLAGVLAAAA